VAKRMTLVLLAGALLLLLATVGPAETASPGTNGKIAYESAGRSDAEIRSTNLDGTDGINLTRNNGIDDRHAAWSLDGEKVAYVSGGDEGFGSDSLSDLYVMNADGSGKTWLTESEGFGESEPTWSPDGTRIAFSRDGIYTMKAAPLGDRNRPRMVVPSEYGYENPDRQPIP
jgi:Tol biopolymer transport system component